MYPVTANIDFDPGILVICMWRVNSITSGFLDTPLFSPGTLVKWYGKWVIEGIFLKGARSVNPCRFLDRLHVFSTDMFAPSRHLVRKIKYNQFSMIYTCYNPHRKVPGI